MNFNFLECLQKVYIGDNFKTDISRFPIEIEDNKIIPSYILRNTDVEGLILRFFSSLGLINFKYEYTEFYYEEKRDPFYIQFRSYFTKESLLKQNHKYSYKRVDLITPVSYNEQDIVSLFLKIGGREDYTVPEFMYTSDFFEILGGLYLDFNREKVYKKINIKSTSFFDVIKYIPWLKIKSGIEINKIKKGVPLNNGTFFFNNIQTPDILHNNIAILSKSLRGEDIFDIFIHGDDKLQYMLDLTSEHYDVNFIKQKNKLVAKDITILQVSRGTIIENKLPDINTYHIIVKQTFKENI